MNTHTGIFDLAMCCCILKRLYMAQCTLHDLSAKVKFPHQTTPHPHVSAPMQSTFPRISKHIILSRQSWLCSLALEVELLTQPSHPCFPPGWADVRRGRGWVLLDECRWMFAWERRQQFFCSGWACLGKLRPKALLFGCLLALKHLEDGKVHCLHFFAAWIRENGSLKMGRSICPQQGSGKHHLSKHRGPGKVPAY